ncbi:uncharacterized protein BT62DRAFT_933307 [Guyanagaster necrorhizus]|uniref:RING-type domain-containing protein n=1 Tax=Guyanagaster necrorhizus TaxID=856835 RepID=A0A9P8ARB3_9AGAR|nr:uncharacterized protein BT62DRAFT_933307 [Guyanagaster necrorhizus MCA 3950]KAG7444905.1 hypothetical protein BT62DRAFT_933307 [Guyanagaster necrorhizus MCA 3950]
MTRSDKKQPILHRRRSLRLSNLENGIKLDDPLKVSLKVYKKRHKVLGNASPVAPAPSCSPTIAMHTRRMTRAAHSDPDSREQALTWREHDLALKSKELDQRLAAVSKKEEETSALLQQAKEREARDIFRQLEEHFTCSLCYEIMASPFSLNAAGQCGHTFCAMCILKWSFSRLHRLCGCWHESVDCPICRSLVVMTPEKPPRLDFTFPFVPNRTASAVCDSWVEKLACALSETKKGRGRKKSRACVDNPTDLPHWREGGAARKEWLRKCSEGKALMSSLYSNWSRLTPENFAAMKDDLGV